MIQDKTAKLDLKTLLAGLNYAFLYEKSYPVFVNAKLTDGELNLLLSKLSKHRNAFGYSLDDIPGIASNLCMHKIHLEDESKSFIENQRRLNPNLRKNSEERNI